MHTRLCLVIKLALLLLLFFHSATLAADHFYGDWHMVKVAKGYVFPHGSDADQLAARGIAFPEPIPWPCMIESDDCWVVPGSLPKAPEYQPYALFIHEYGYTFIEITREDNAEHLRWGWKMSVENKSKNDVVAHAFCTLRDKNDFVLATYNDRYAVGTIIWKGQKAILKDDAIWSFDRRTRPYPPTRVRSIKCTLLLKHAK